MSAVSYDTETTNLSRHRGNMFSFSTCTEGGETRVYRLDGNAVRVAISRLALEKLWADRQMAKVMHNLKFDLGFTEKMLSRVLDTGQTLHDTHKMSHILQNDHKGHGLKELCWELAGYPRDDETAIHKYTAGGRSYQNVPEQLMEKYQHRDAERTMLLYQFFWPKIQASKDFREIYQYEVDLQPVTLRMENRGVMIDRNKCKSLITELQAKTSKAMDEIESVVGERVSPNAAAFRYHLYRILDVPVTMKTKAGLPSTDQSILMEMRLERPHPLIELVLQYREYSRGATMIESYMEKADTNDVLHPNIHTCQAITGRESCSDPNLQNVEKEINLQNPYPVAARKVFRPRPGYVNFHVDYAGIEMRLLIHYSGDEELVKICMEGGDVHLPATLIFFPEEYSSSTDPKHKKALRDQCKQANFAIAYGAQLPKVAGVLGLDMHTAGKRLSQYRKRFPRLGSLMGSAMEEVAQTGKVFTTFGRNLYIPTDQKHMGINYRIQGTAAEIIKRAQVRVHRYLEKNASEFHMLLPIHDELIIECPRHSLKDAREVLTAVAHEMTDFSNRFTVPLEVEVDVATVDWAHKSKYKLLEAK